MRVAIPCPTCGREYDVTLFQYGRTIECACGTRVGHRLEVAREGRERAPRFMVDVMLGGLARWLRILGYDAEYVPGIEDAELVKRAVDGGRIVLTRDRGLPAEWWVDNCLLIDSDAPMDQLREVVDSFGLSTGDRLFTRCTICNEPLQEMHAGEAERVVPARVRESNDSFSRCPVCERIYWRGSHVDRMRRRLMDLFGDTDSRAGAKGPRK
jgi:uncharacterized protein with PIN domain